MLDFNHQQLITKLRQYFAHKGIAELPFTSDQGLCAGLVAYWLYCKRCNNNLFNERLFFHELNQIANWDYAKFKAMGLATDPLMEHFINLVMFLQFDVFLRSGVRQDQLDQTINFMLDHDMPHVAPCEQQLTFVFDHPTLVNLTAQIALNNKMIKITDGLHAIGLMASGTDAERLYFLFDPAGTQKLTSYSSADHLVKAIFTAFKTTRDAHGFLAIKCDRFDLVGSSTRASITSEQYYQEQFADPHYALAVLRHPNIFHLAVKYHDFTLTDLLFAHGYKYIPWTLSACTEFEDAVIANDAELFDYLQAHDIPVDYASPTDNGVTPLARAIMQNNLDMQYRLLAAGANPNLPANDYYSLLEVCVENKDNKRIASIILLIASGLEITTRDLIVLKRNFNADQLRAITHQAVSLNAKLLGIAEAAPIRDDFAEIKKHKPLDLGRKFNIICYSNQRASASHQPLLSFEQDIKPFLTL